MDQSFSPKNLRKIWDLEARRGRDRLQLYPEVRRAYELARDALHLARSARNGSVAYIGPPESAPDAVARAARQDAEELLDASLAATSEALVGSVESDAFAWGLAPGHVVGSKRQTYSIAKTPEAFFADKHLQSIVTSYLPTRPRGRQSIVAGLIRTIDNDVPKIVVRVDVKEFYESIDHRRLRSHLDITGLSPSCRRLIDGLLTEMEVLTGKPKGLPAGVGLSAKLAELYIAQTDRALRDSQGTLYFARYVDDIVLVRGEEAVSAVAPSSVVAEIEAELQRIDLSLNSGKTLSPELEKNSTQKIEFLGYEIEYRGGAGLLVRLTDARYKTIRDRIDRTFSAWDRADSANHGRRSLLLDRLRFLTANTRLSYNKRNALVGIYFSNPHLTDVQSLAGLDSYLRQRASQSALPPGLDKKIEALSFEKGFRRRTVHRWSMPRMKRLKGAWLA
ncbi:RNA-directed DNA polymerase [Herbiconiux sp. CPCC 205716]|uniref:RNA-directed DNA polymerase n=1 Tax=Herbiconiux gentiana TaxID=2970912 RepID=A0ABT2GIH5_9MICO|nr:antiviral reverse transcriptase Drt3a [Herbiconiux gentiana]MCS5714694.1 RNA-directed DNA polymerase [Herbiconiux gentiana]